MPEFSQPPGEQPEGGPNAAASGASARELPADPQRPEGHLWLVDKPLNWTSFDVVNKLRRSLGVKKLGHAGTLDPLATGLLILASGKKTRQIQEIQDAPKSYEALVQLGGVTPSYDAETPPQNLLIPPVYSPEELEEALEQFRGSIEQVPPAYSALKVGGKRAYNLARQGKPPDLKPRQVTITRLEVLAYNPREHQLRLRVNCSKGTYIRSLAHDLGQSLGVGGYLAGLVRTAIGAYHLAEAWPMAELVQALSDYRQQQQNP